MEHTIKLSLGKGLPFQQLEGRISLNGKGRLRAQLNANGSALGISYMLDLDKQIDLGKYITCELDHDKRGILILPYISMTNVRLSGNSVFSFELEAKAIIITKLPEAEIEPKFYSLKMYVPTLFYQFETGTLEQKKDSEGCRIQFSNPKIQRLKVGHIEVIVGAEIEFEEERSHFRASAKFKSFIELRFDNQISPNEAWSNLQIVQEFLATIFLGYVPFEKCYVGSQYEEASDRIVWHELMDSSKTYPTTKIEDNRHLAFRNLTFPFFANGILWFFNNSKILDEIVKRLRLFHAPDRFLEEKFLSIVQAIELLGKVKDFQISIDSESSAKCESILRILESSGQETLVVFFKNRVLPIFSKLGLSNILTEMQSKYLNISVFQNLDVRKLATARGKLVHGSIASLTEQQYQLMADFNEYAWIIVRIELLKMACPEFEWQNIKSSFRFNRLFDGDAAQ